MDKGIIAIYEALIDAYGPQGGGPLQEVTTLEITDIPKTKKRPLRLSQGGAHTKHGLDVG